MCAQIPVYDICNLINNDDKNIHCNVLDLQTFVSQSQQLVSTAHRHSFYQILVVFNGSGDHHIDFKTRSLGFNFVQSAKASSVIRALNNNNRASYKVSSLLYKSKALQIAGLYFITKTQLAQASCLCKN